MIGLQESNIDIRAVHMEHTTFVSAYVEKTIQFYEETLTLLNSLKRTTTPIPAFNKRVQEIRDRLRCDHYKRLLGSLLKGKNRVDNEHEAYRVRYSSKRIIGDNKLSSAIVELQHLLLHFPYFLDLKFLNSPADVSHYDRLRSTYNVISPLLRHIFDYDWFSDLEPDGPWGAYQLTKKLKTNSCPYCNSQYTFTMATTGGKKIARPQLDHFLPRKQHPCLALTFYNLIPSCSNCNSSVKGAISISYGTHLNPFEDNAKHSLTRFSYIPLSYEASVGKSDELTITTVYNGDSKDMKLKDKVEGNISLFQIPALYKNHTDTVQEIISKRHISSDTYIDVLQNTYKSLNLTKEEAYRLAFGNYFEETNFNRRPLSKLTKDIAVELSSLVPFTNKP